MKKPRTIGDALTIILEFGTVISLGLTVIIVASYLTGTKSFRFLFPVLVFLNFFSTLPTAIYYGGRAAFAWILRKRPLTAGELVAGETIKRPSLPIFLYEKEREGHIGIFGATRSGKSTLAESLAAQDISRSHPTIVIDPHASMVEALTAHSLAVGKVPCLLQTDSIHMTTLNLLETGPGYSAYDAARIVAEGLSNTYIPFEEELPVRIRSFLEVGSYFLAAANEGFTLLELPRFILQPSFREYLAKKVGSNSDNAEWLEPEQAFTILAWYDSLTPTQRYQQIQSTITRLAGLLSAPGSRRLLGGTKSSFSFGEVIEGSPLLIALQREELHHGAHLANGMVLTWLTHQLRTMLAAASGFFDPTYMYLDELADVSPAVFESLLLIAGKRSVRLMFMVQAAAMLNPNLRKSLLANISALFVLRSAGEGVPELAESIFVPPTFDPEVAFGGQPTSRRQQVFDLAQNILSLPQHHFLFRSASRPDSLIYGRSSLSYRVKPAIAAAARSFTLQRRGKLVLEIDKEIKERTYELNARFGPLQEYRDNQMDGALAPW